MSIKQKYDKPTKTNNTNKCAKKSYRFKFSSCFWPYFFQSKKKLSYYITSKLFQNFY